MTQVAPKDKPQTATPKARKSKGFGMKPATPIKREIPLDMLDQWNTATTYGRVSLHQTIGTQKGNIFCRIEMLSKNGVTVSATSNYFADPAEALADAIEKARSVRGLSVAEEVEQ